MAEGKALAITALALGIVGLFTAGGLGGGSLLGLALAGVALTGASRAGRDVAWAAVAANVLALLTLLPVGAAILAYRASPLVFRSDDDSLPKPKQDPFVSLLASPALPPPPAPLEAVRTGVMPAPRRIHNVHPVYPRAAVEARLEGVVALELTISPKGKVVQVRTLRGVSPLSEAAVEAVKQWEYTPTVLNGVPVPVIMTVKVNFKLNPARPPS